VASLEGGDEVVVSWVEAKLDVVRELVVVGAWVDGYWGLHRR
jgi:hypothetical protein